ELRGHAGWVAAVVTRMRPAVSVDLESDLDARARYLEDLWGFAGALPPSANSLKAHILWHLLDAARRRGVAFGAELFRAYLALPRSATYMRGGTDRARADEVTKLGADFATVTGLPPAGPDEELIRDVVQQQIDGAEGYAAWLDRSWLEAEI